MDRATRATAPMEALLSDVDWAKVLLPRTPLLEILVRGSVTYLALFALLRFTFKREAGAASISTMLVIVLIADAAQNAMADDYASVTDGLLLVSVIIGCSFLLDWLSSRVRQMRTLTHPAPLLLVEDGRLLEENLRREIVTEEELWTQLRHQGSGHSTRWSAPTWRATGRSAYSSARPPSRDGSSGGRREREAAATPGERGPTACACWASAWPPITRSASRSRPPRATRAAGVGAPSASAACGDGASAGPQPAASCVTLASRS